MYLIRALAAKYKLTRTSLLHYDSIGLLSPSGRTEAGYRIYSEDDEKRLQDILLFRSMGIPLTKIKILLSEEQSNLANILFKRLGDLNNEIEKLKKQQENIITLLKEVKSLERFLSKEKSGQIDFLLQLGMSAQEYHQQFEATSPKLYKELVATMHTIPDKMKTRLLEATKYISKSERKKLKALIEDAHKD